MCQCMRKNSMDFGTKSTSQNGLLTTESRVQYINKTYLKYVCLILIDQFLSCTEVCEESQNKGNESGRIPKARVIHGILFNLPI